MQSEELEYFVTRWQTKAFNLHLFSEYPLENDLSKYFSQIFIENTYEPILSKNLENLAGLCLDFSHMEDARLSFPDLYKQWQEIFSQYPVGCAHVSAIRKDKGWLDKENFLRFSQHWFDELSDFDYLKNYSLKNFPEFIAIEVGNSLAEQLKAKKYIEKLLSPPVS